MKIEHAIEFAARAHAGQKDKSGAAYIFHPIRVMMRLSNYPEHLQIAGVLRAVNEMTPYTRNDLEAIFGKVLQ